MTEQLTVQDIDVLIDALEQWVVKDAAGEMFGVLMDLALAPAMSDQQKVDYEQKKHDMKQKAEDARWARKGQAVILQAKLFMLRNTLEAEQMLRRGES